MRKFVVQIALILTVLIGGYLALFKRDEVLALFEDAKHHVQGYKKATTPDEALDYFNKALEERDYEPAADYLSGDYAIQFRKVAPAAEKLAEAVDNFRHAAELHGIHSERVNALLARCEPFPKRLKVIDLKKSESGEAVAVVSPESGSLPGGLGTTTIRLRREGEGDDAPWKLALTVTPRVRYLFDEIERYGQDYVNALNVVRNRMRTDATTKVDVANDLQEELRKVREP